MDAYLESLGLSIYLNFINAEEEQELIKNIPSASKNIKKTKARNNIFRYGSELPYKSNIISQEIPNCFCFLLDRLQEKQLVSSRPDSISINEYLEDQCIAKHIDSKSSGPVISVLSLLSDAKMIFTLKKEKLEVCLPARSLVQMRDKIRNEWFHEIEPVKHKRYSVVFRVGQKD